MAPNESDLARQLAEARREVAQQREEAARQREEAARQRKLAERERKRAEDSEAEKAPTAFVYYLQLVQQRLVSTLRIEPNPNLTASGSVTTSNRKYYPLELHLWDDFEPSHSETFDLFLQQFADKPLFPSQTDVLGIQRDLSPNTRKSEEDIRPFVRTAIEKPAARVVMAHLSEIGVTEEFFFQNNAYSLENKDEDEVGRTDASPSNKKRSPERTSKPIPDRWGICKYEHESVRRVCIGEYKAAHKVRADKITEALTSPSTALFLEVLRRKQSGRTNTDEENSQDLVAQILCQAYHYMITSGLLYGYVTSGEALIFLKIEKTTPQRLYFYLTPVRTDVPVRYASAAQLATFSVLALQETEMSRDWISKAEDCGIYQWPLLPPTNVLRELPLRPLKPSEETSDSSGPEKDDPKDSEYKDSSTSISGSRSKQHQTTNRERRRSPRKRPSTQRPVNAYCTQACLLGLAQGLSLDQKCPNAALHRRGSVAEKHLINKEDLCFLVRKQLGRSLDKDCECLDRIGLYGAIGVLFKITLTKYGYTFVAKGVQRVDEPSLENEARVYAHLSHLQGMRIPVWMGNITLERPYPLVSLARVTQMMLMAWAGSSIRTNSLPNHIDIEEEKKKTEQALISSNVSHNDIRNANMVWNAEREQIMALDFDQSVIHKRKASNSPSSAESPKSRRIRRGRKQKQKQRISASHSEAMESGKENMLPENLGSPDEKPPVKL